MSQNFCALKGLYDARVIGAASYYFISTYLSSFENKFFLPFSRQGQMHQIAQVPISQHLKSLSFSN